MTTESSGSVRERLAAVQARVAAAAARAGRDAATVRLLAVSKTVPLPLVREAYAAGQRLFGENRVQELVGKVGALPPDAEWHLIGHLQGNKARPALACARLLHAVDSLALLDRLNRLAAAGQRQDVLLEVNISGEASKFGLPPDVLEPVLSTAVQLPHLRCLGLMTMAPYGADQAALHRVFGGLRDLRDRLATRLGAPLPELSMGMSGDFETAIAEGATIVRVGTAIFGARPEPT